MLALVIVPIADLRQFVGAPNAGKLPLPDWRLAPRSRNPEFLRGIGELRKRGRYQDSQYLTWPSEGWYSTARQGIRLPQVTSEVLPTTPPHLKPNHVIRRIFSDGHATWRVEIGVAFSTSANVSFADALAAATDVVGLPVSIYESGAWTPKAPLLEQRTRVARMLALSTSVLNGAPAAPSPLVRVGRPLVLIESHAADDRFPLSLDVQASSKSRKFESDRGSAQIKGLATALRVRGEDMPVVCLTSQKSSSASDVWGYRVTLCRLHTEREVLTHVFRALHRGEIPEVNANLERYFSHAHAEYFADVGAAARNASLKDIFSAYDSFSAAERDALLALLRTRPQSRDRVSVLLDQFKDSAVQPVFVMNGGKLEMTNSTTNNTTNIGTNYGQINVASTFNNSQVAINALPQDSDLQGELSKLLELSKKLTSTMSDSADQQSIANKTESLVKEAASPKPDKEILKVTGKGLIEAAKTVAELAKPIATAVMAVLGLLGIVL